MPSPMDPVASLEAAVAAPHSMADADLRHWLLTEDAAQVGGLFAAAREVRRRCGKSGTLLRGLVEVSNFCAKDCFYCGIRSGRPTVARYRMSEAEVAACVREARRRGYPAVAFQAGEIEGAANTAFYERLVRRCTDGSEGAPLEVTLSLGEQEESVYRRWKEASGNAVLRYLIRIETSNPRLYAAIHPRTCSFERRVGCIRSLRRLGYVTGSGVMIGLPGQTVDDLVADLRFYAEEKLDMIGMGPYVPCAGTPLAEAKAPDWTPSRRLDLSLRMIALTRLQLHAVNIVAATALDALAPRGCDRGLDAGANVRMPNLTPQGYRAGYVLYPGKSTAL